MESRRRESAEGENAEGGANAQPAALVAEAVDDRCREMPRGSSKVRHRLRDLHEINIRRCCDSLNMPFLVV